MKYTIYIKPTNRCNLRCLHCYNSITSGLSDMTDDIIEKTIKSITIFSEQHDKDLIDIQFHGGEPMLFKIEKLNYFVKKLNILKNVKFCVTTNLTYDINDSHIEFFKNMMPYDNQPVIMTSWDKKIRFTDDTFYQKWLSNVKRLVDLGICVQPIVCVTKYILDTDPHNIFELMTSLGISVMNFERLTRTGRANENDIFATNQQVDNWLYSAWEASHEFSITIPLFDAVEQSCNGFLLGCRARRCMKTVLTVNPDGSLAACPNTANIIIGKVTESGFSFNEKAEYLCTAEQMVNEKCLSCYYFKYCNGDCCQLQHDSTGCPGLISIYKELIK